MRHVFFLLLLAFLAASSCGGDDNPDGLYASCEEEWEVCSDGFVCLKSAPVYDERHFCTLECSTIKEATYTKASVIPGSCVDADGCGSGCCYIGEHSLDSSNDLSQLADPTAEVGGDGFTCPKDYDLLYGKCIHVEQELKYNFTGQCQPDNEGYEL